MSQTKRQKKPMHKALKITLIILGGVIGLVVLAVTVFLLYATLRPLNKADYRTALEDVKSIDGAPLRASQAMTSTLMAPLLAQNKQQLENRYANSKRQVTTVAEYVDEAGRNRALSKDADAKAAYQKLLSASNDYRSYIDDFEDLYLPTANYWRGCYGLSAFDEEDPDKVCADLRQEVKKALSRNTGTKDQRALGELVIAYEDNEISSNPKSDELRDKSNLIGDEMSRRATALTTALKGLITLLEQKAA